MSLRLPEPGSFEYLLRPIRIEVASLVRLSRYPTTVVAILGTTISPYLFFWEADQEVEEIKRIDADKPLRVAPHQAAAQIRRLHIDTFVGMGFSSLIAIFMIVATAATLHAHGISRRQRRRLRR